MGDVTVVNMDIVTDKSGHAFTPMAVSACITPMAPAPVPIPYPVTGTSTEGVTDECMRTKVNGAKTMTVGSVFNACHGNEPGTLKEVVSLNTGGPCFAVMGAPTIFIELGMPAMTGSPGFLNKAVTVGAGGSASGASGATAGGGSGDSGSSSNADGNKKDPSNSGGGGGGKGDGASATPADPKTLAAEKNADPDDGKNAARVAARKKVAEDFYKEHGKKWDPNQKDPKTGKFGVLRSHTDAERRSEMKGIDFNKPLSTHETPPPGRLYQWQAEGKQKPPGQYFSQNPQTKPAGMGIGNYGVTRPAGEIKEKVSTPYDVPPGQPYLKSTAAPAKDDWSVYKAGKNDPHGNTIAYKGIKQDTPGGDEQIYYPKNGPLSPSGPSTPLSAFPPD